MTKRIHYWIVISVNRSVQPVCYAMKLDEISGVLKDCGKRKEYGPK